MLKCSDMSDKRYWIAAGGELIGRLLFHDISEKEDMR